jgi:hypothetical protein
LTEHPCANCKTTQKKSGFSTKNHRSSMPPDSAFTYGLIGSRGAGKSLFIYPFFTHLMPEELKNRAAGNPQTLSERRELSRGRERVCDYFDDDRVCDCRGFPEHFALILPSLAAAWWVQLRRAG